MFLGWPPSYLHLRGLILKISSESVSICCWILVKVNLFIFFSPEAFLLLIFFFFQRINYFRSPQDMLLKHPQVENFLNHHFLICWAVRGNMAWVSVRWPRSDFEVSADTDGSDAASTASGCLLCLVRLACTSITCTPGMWDDTLTGARGIITHN